MRILFTLLFIFVAFTAFAQDIDLEAETVTAPSGTIVTIDVIVTSNNWNNIIVSSGTITFDETIADYSALSNFATLGSTPFGLSDFNVSNASNGVITWNWANFISIGGSLSPNTVLFTLEFNVIGNDGDTCDIEFSNSPVPLSWLGGVNQGTYNGTPGAIIVGGLNLTGCYDPQFWTTNTDNTNGSVSHNGGTITMTGDNDQTGNGTTDLDCEGTQGNVSYCNTIPNDGTVSFDWDYDGNIENANSDAFGYCLNGVGTQLALPPPPFGGTPFGTASFAVVAGDELCFVMSSESANQPNAPVVTISEFEGPDCELPTLSAIITLVSPVTCNGDANASVQVTTFDGTGDETITWDVPGVEGFNPSGLSAGTYCATVMDAVPDTFETCITITQAPPLTVSSQANPDNGTGTGMALLTVSGGQPNSSPPSYDIVWDTDPVQTGFIASGLDEGVYTYTVTDALGCEVVGEVTIIYVGIEELTGLDSFTYFPNPASESFNVDIKFNQTKAFNLYIINSVGEKVLELGSMNSSTFNERIDISFLTKGFYFLNIDVEGQRITRKLTVN